MEENENQVLINKVFNNNTTFFIASPVAIPVTWPEGTYSLPKANSGCPSGDFTWYEGWRLQDTESQSPDNAWSTELNLDGTCYRKTCKYWVTWNYCRNFSKNWTKFAATWQNQQSDCAPSEDSDQPGHPPSLIRIFAVRMKKAWVLIYSLSTQRRLWSDWAGAQADLSLRRAHTHFLVLSCRGSNGSSIHQCIQ